jgi:hypothetical protein
MEHPVRVKEVKVAKVRAVYRISYAEAIKIFERASEVEEIVVVSPMPKVNRPICQPREARHAVCKESVFCCVLCNCDKLYS